MMRPRPRLRSVGGGSDPIFSERLVSSSFGRLWPVSVVGTASLFATALAGCSSAKPSCGSEGGVFFRFSAEPLFETYTLRLESTGSEPFVAQCPEGPANGLTCTLEGAALARAPGQLAATLKAAGFRYLRQAPALRYEGAEVDGGCVRAKVELSPTPLSAFVANDDYRTGFSRQAGLGEFIAMAYPAQGELGQTRTVKFYMDGLDTDSPRVYFQNTQRHPIHYDFVRGVLGKAVSLSEFEAATYHGAHRTAMAGSIVYYPDRRLPSAALGAEAVAPLTVEFLPVDDLTPSQALEAVLLLHERMLFVPLTGGEHRLFYLPAGSSQQSSLEASKADFTSWSEPALAREELYSGLTEQLLNPGIAFGTLRTVAAEEIDASAVSFHDVIVLPRLPNRVPIVGGTITGELQTPLAHVNVAARARGTPNLALTTVETDPRVAALMGKLVRFEVGRTGFTLREATLSEAQAFWDSRVDQPRFVPEADCAREGLPGFEELSFADSKSVGVKAANLSEMSNLIPDQTPPDGFAVAFHYYDEFLTSSLATAALCDAAQADCLAPGTRAAGVCARARALCLPAGTSSERLRDQIHRLLGDPTFTTDSRVREATLSSLRFLISNSPVEPAFASALDARVFERMGTKKVKLRSSTNAEDLPRFSGAGLYDSYSAESSGGKAASSRIRLVWASVWNWRAFEERSFWNIDQEALRMGVLVNPSYSDEEANGVLVTQNIANPGLSGMYVNVQKGESSVTNPEDGALPETFSIISAPAGIQVARERFSSLSPNQPLMTDSEILALLRTALKVQQHFAPLYGVESSKLKLDIEFKLRAGDRAVVFKQVRPYYQGSQP
jgi:pyruvate,water dikinase